MRMRHWYASVFHAIVYTLATVYGGAHSDTVAQVLQSRLILKQKIQDVVNVPPAVRVRWR
jgi:hypothetical protein